MMTYRHIILSFHHSIFMITIEKYNPEWPAEFANIRTDLQNVLGPLAIQIDHIGSTSVPGLGAKDIIDVQITVNDLSDGIYNKLLEAGYQPKPHLTDHVPKGEDPNPDLWRKRMVIERPDERKANIHIRLAGNPNQRYALLFRDYLRAHPKSVQTIELIKRELARYHPNDWDAYYDIKDPVYDLIWDAAQDWANMTGWDEQDAQT